MQRLINRSSPKLVMSNRQNKIIAIAFIAISLITIASMDVSNVMAKKHHHQDAQVAEATPAPTNPGFLNTGLPLVDLSGHNGDSLLNRALCSNFNLC